MIIWPLTQLLCITGIVIITVFHSLLLLVGVGVGGEYPEFCLLHRLGLFLWFRILYFTIFFRFGEKEAIFWGIGHLQVFLRGHFQNWLFFFFFWFYQNSCVLFSLLLLVVVVVVVVEPSVELIVIFILLKQLYFCCASVQCHQSKKGATVGNCLNLSAYITNTIVIQEKKENHTFIKKYIYIFLWGMLISAGIFWGYG